MRCSSPSAPGRGSIALASTDEKRELAQRLGADATVDSRAEDLGEAILEANDGKPVDVVLEMTGGPTFEACLRTLAPFGRMVVFGIASREQNEVTTGHLLRNSRSVIGFWLMHLVPHREQVAAMIGDLLGAVASGELEIVDRRRLPALGGAPRPRGPGRAQDPGKLLLDPSRDDRASQGPRPLPRGDPARDRRARLRPSRPPIQEQAIPELLAGHDVIGQAQTGTGKTAAFGLPLLQYLDPDSDETQAIVLTPTRELCIQVTQALRAYAEHLDIEIVAVFGGAPIRPSSRGCAPAPTSSSPPSAG